MADNNRRTGDWQNRHHDEANTLAGPPNPKKWYQQTFWIVVLVLVFWPVGIVLAWRSEWHIVIKIIVTILVALCVYMAWTMNQAVIQGAVS